MRLEERRKSAGKITLNIREGGNGRLIVFLHGVTANAAVWDPVLQELQNSFHVVSVDQRGHGKSDKPMNGYTAADFAGDTLELIKELGGGAPAIIVGHSLGARNALVAGVQQPDLVAAVIAIDFTPFIEEEVFVSLETRVKSGDRLFASIDEIVAYLVDRYPLIPQDALERRARHGYVESGGGFRPLADPSAMAATVAGLRDDLAPAVRAIARPTLLVRGALSKLVSPVAFDKSRGLRPDFSTLVVPDADHYVPEEAPGAITSAIRSFISEL